MTITEAARTFRIYKNSFRRKLVNLALGNDLILEKIETDSGCKLQLIDTKRRINYGYWNAEKISRKDIKLSR